MAIRALLHRHADIKDPYEYDCDTCEHERAEGAERCIICPFDDVRMFSELRAAHGEFPETQELLPFIGRLWRLRGVIKALGRSLVMPTPDELTGLLIIEDEQNKLEQSKASQMESEADRIRDHGR